MRRLLAATALALALATGAAALPQGQGTVELLRGADAEWDGPADSATGTSIAAIGPGALAIGAPEAEPGGRLNAGSVYVVVGGIGSGTVDLTALRGRGYRIDGAAAGDGAGFALASLTLADGHPGLAIGAPTAGAAEQGAVYIVDLTRLHGDIDLGARPAALVGVLTGSGPCAQSGYSLAPGLRARGRGTMLLVGSPGADPSGCPVSKPGGTSAGGAGAVYAVAPRGLTRSLTLGAHTAFVGSCLGGSPGDRAGTAVGWIPGAGRMLIGAPDASPLGRPGAGAVYVLAPPAPGAVVALAKPTGGSAVFFGAAADDALGFSVATTSGFARGERPGAVDLVLGAPQASPLARREAGAVYVLPAAGRRGAIDLAGVPTIAGAAAGDEAGYALAGLGSLDGTGRAALGIGAPFVNSRTGPDRIDNGAAYVVFGGRGAAGLDLGDLRSRGFSAFGARNSDEAGTALAGLPAPPGGRPTVLIGAPFAQSRFGTAGPVAGGAVYGLLGLGAPVLRYRGGIVRARVGRRLVLAPAALTATGPARFAVSPALPAGLRLGRADGWVRGVPRRPAAARRYAVTLTDSSGVVTAYVKIAVAR